MIKAILFDVGGVLNVGQSDVILERIAGKRRDYETIRRYHDGRWDEIVDRGDVEAGQFYADLIARFKLKVKLKEIQSLYEGTLKRIPGTWNIVRELHGKYRLGILSNMSHEFEEVRKEHFPFDELFEVQLWSADVQEVKPHRNIYEHMLALLQLSAHECVFIDDRQQNIDTAIAIGMQGIVFEDPAQLRRDLVALGIELEGSTPHE